MCTSERRRPSREIDRNGPPDVAKHGPINMMSIEENHGLVNVVQNEAATMLFQLPELVPSSIDLFAEWRVRIEDAEPRVEVFGRAPNSFTSSRTAPPCQRSW